MEIRDAQTTDKEAVLDFCKSTFSWGDYIQDAWDDWISEGNLFVLCENKLAVAVCHAFFMNKKQVWIEGIRVSPNFRKKGYATKLVTYSEYVAKERECKTSKMLIESNNFKSLNLAESLNYSKSELWDFYALSPKKTLVADNLMQAPNSSVIQEFLSDAKYYVRSWRWILLDKSEISFLIGSRKIFISKNNDVIDSLAAAMASDHFDNTLLVTLIYATSTGFEKIFKYLQNMAHEKDHKKIQILTKIKNLPNYPDLEKRLSFYLMEKNLV